MFVLIELLFNKTNCPYLVFRTILQNNKHERGTHFRIFPKRHEARDCGNYIFRISCSLRIVQSPNILDISISSNNAVVFNNILDSSTLRYEIDLASSYRGWYRSLLGNRLFW